MIYLAVVSTAAILFLAAAVIALITNQAQERREWTSERNGLVNLITMGIPMQTTTQDPNQKLPEYVTPPPIDSSEYEKVGQVYDFPPNGNDKE